MFTFYDFPEFFSEIFFLFPGFSFFYGGKSSNTATQNEVNRINAQATLGLSVAAQNNLWQSYRDEATWLVQLSERGIDRAHQAAMIAQQANIAEDMSYTDTIGDILSNVGTIALDRIFPKKESG